MKHVILAILIVISVYSQELRFQREVDSIPFYYNDVRTGSPFMGGNLCTSPSVADIDNDGDIDLCIGNIEGRIIFFRNTGTTSSPEFNFDSSIDTSICVGSQSFPDLVDIDSDGDIDLLVGEESGNINFYKNIGNRAMPRFQLISETFADISCDYAIIPSFVDIDSDGDLDLYYGNFEQGIQFMQNAGSATSPYFVPKYPDDLKMVQGMSPTLIDIDGDKDFDLFTGSKEGQIRFYRNTGDARQPHFVEANFPYLQCGSESSPVFADVDDDSDFDMIVGEWDGSIKLYNNVGYNSNPKFKHAKSPLDSSLVNSSCALALEDFDFDGDLDFLIVRFDGSLSFFENKGTAFHPVFNEEVKNYGSLLVGDCFYPAFADVDSDNDLDLLIGNFNGSLSFYRNIGSNDQVNYVLESTSLDSVEIGINSRPTFSDIDNDNDYDLFVGEHSGNINFFRNIGDPHTLDLIFETENFEHIQVGLIRGTSSPFFNDFDYDGDPDLFVGSNLGCIHYYENIGTPTAYNFILRNDRLADINLGFDMLVSPLVGDMDGDSDSDLFVRRMNGAIDFFENTGQISELYFELSSKNLTAIDMGRTSTPTLCDIDADSDYDLFLGEYDGNITFFRNTGTVSNPVFQFETDNFVAIDHQRKSAPVFMDMDADADLDLILGADYVLRYYENQGNKSDPKLKLSHKILATASNGTFAQNYVRPACADLDFDGDFDLLVGNRNQIWFCENSGDPTSPYFFRSFGYRWDANILDSPAFADLDYDFDKELIFGNRLGALLMYDYVDSFKFDYRYIFKEEILLEKHDRLDITPTFADLDNDGDQDLIIGESLGGLYFYRNVSPREKLVQLSKDFMEFQAVAQGDTKLDSIIISNVGSYSLKLIKVHIKYATDFSLSKSDSFPIFIPPQSDMAIHVLFAPKSIGAKFDTLTIQCNDPIEQFIKIPLQGLLKTSASSDISKMPNTFKLGPIYPNPANSISTINFQLPKKEHIQLDIYDILGKRVISLVNDVKEAGFYSIKWQGEDTNGSQVASGLYFVQFKSNAIQMTQSLILLR